MSSALNLTSLTGGSRQVVIAVDQGRPVIFDPAATVATAAMSARGVSTRLRLISYHEEGLEEGEDGIGFIKAVATSTGNATLIPLVRESKSSNDLDYYHGDFSMGTTSITISSTRQAEKAIISYDPVTFSSATITGTPLSLVYGETALVGGLGGADWPVAGFDADVVVIKVGTSDYYLCVRKASALYEKVLAPAHASAASAKGSKAVRLTSEPPDAGLGWSLFNEAKKNLFKAADVHLDSSVAPIEFVADGAVVDPAFAFRDEWVAFKLASLESSGASGNLLRVFWQTLTPTDGDVAKVALSTVAQYSPADSLPSRGRRIKTVWNAEAVSDGSENPFGGVYTN